VAYSRPANIGNLLSILLQTKGQHGMHTSSATPHHFTGEIVTREEKKT
jgi:hypothetical protein